MAKKIIVNLKQDAVLGQCYEVVLEPALAAASYVSVCPEATREHVEQLQKAKGYEVVEDNAGLFRKDSVLELVSVEHRPGKVKRFHFRDNCADPHAYAEATMRGGNLVIKSCTFEPPTIEYAKVRHLLLEYYELETSSVQVVIPIHGGNKKFIFSHDPSTHSWAIANAHGAMIESELPVGSPRRLTQARLISEYFKNGKGEKPTVCLDKPVGCVTQGGPQTQVVAVFTNAEGYYVNASLIDIIAGEPEVDRVSLTVAKKWRITRPERQIPVFRKYAKAAGLGVVFLNETVGTTYEFYESFGVEELAQPIPPAPKPEETEGARITVFIYKKVQRIEMFFECCEYVPGLEQRLKDFKTCLGIGRRFSSFEEETPLFNNTLIMRCMRGDNVNQGDAAAHIEKAIQENFNGIPFEVKTVANFG